MKRHLLFWLFALCCGALAAASSTGPPGPHDMLFLRASDVTWDDSPGAEELQTKVIWSDPQTGAYGAYTKRRAGHSVPLHTHSQDSRVLVFSGTLVLTLEGHAPQELGTGAYGLLPGGAKHTSSCKAGAVCYYYEEQPGPADTAFVGAK